MVLQSVIESVVVFLAIGLLSHHFANASAQGGLFPGAASTLGALAGGFARGAGLGSGGQGFGPGFGNQGFGRQGFGGPGYYRSGGYGGGSPYSGGKTICEIQIEIIDSA